ncbi:MAG: hypothetical protein GWN67_23910, partial [Phycisphaerae bacterium]|nr:hypothetical protein [Phycisphaerae bacterium]NIV16461.1 hypothetical protein [Fodinibius sp.]NIW11199.1 hypothetical protein [Gammaproteobacteria bacterium]
MIDPNIIKPYPDLRAQECMTAFASGTSPVAILNLDNNLEIALNLIKPRTLNELRANGIPVLESQRVLLNLWGIIEMVENNRYRFIPPLLVGEKLDAVRYKTKRLASLLLENSQS